MKIRQLENGEQVPIELLLQADPSEKLINEYVRIGECYVAELKERVIGTYVLLEKNTTTIELKNIAVNEEFQGRGLGKELLFHSIEQARKMGYRTIEVGTGNSSIGQLAFYQKCGFRIIEIDHDFFLRHYPEPIVENGIQCLDMIVLRLVLQ
ncbi:GNAT family N-acetyltransferase [Metabacillus schmidteae]|uniref:GNAT family N-acetyltransferase n=1 Tax=Metabacillus schmidteae TaxID=2730405 RepID=UPI00158B3E53|nr:GNAT family N-acetyltransferase [Metabacillus schmidteae]